MSEKTIYESPVSQSFEAVQILLAGMGVHRERPPASVKMSDTCFLVLSARQDQYYVTTAQGCSCPSHQWRGRPLQTPTLAFDRLDLVYESKVRFLGASNATTSGENTTRINYIYHKICNDTKHQQEIKASDEPLVAKLIGSSETPATELAI